MYRRPKFLEILLEIRREMALEADYDVELFAEFARSGKNAPKRKRRPVDTEPVSAEEESTAVVEDRQTRSGRK